MKNVGPFQCPPWSVDLSVDCQNAYISFLDYFSFRDFLSICPCFHNISLRSLSFVLSFKQHKPVFCRLNVLLCSCITKNLQGNFLLFFKTFKKTFPVQRINETKLTSEDAIILYIFALAGEKISQYVKRTPFQDSPQSLDLSLNPQPPKQAYISFSGLFQCQAFFGNFLLFLGIKSNLIKFCTKFQLEQAKISPHKCTSLLLRSNSVQRNCLYFFKNFISQCAL